MNNEIQARQIVSRLFRLPLEIAQVVADELQQMIRNPSARQPSVHDSPGPYDGIEYPQLGNGPNEQVFAFNNNEFIKLENFPAAPYFSSHGPLTDLWRNVLQGSRLETTFPVNPSTIDGANAWPNPQTVPFDSPPVDQTNTTGHGYSKQAYYFGDGSSFVTVGPSLPKIAKLKSGGAQFWVGSIGTIAQGSGRFAGVRGVTTYVGSGYIPVWPETFEEQGKVLQAGFRALVGTYVKVVFADDLALNPRSSLSRVANPT